MPEIYSRDVVLQRFILALLLAVNSVLFCASLAFLAPFDEYHIFYDGARLSAVLFVVVPFSLVSLLFVFAEFSFGYFVGFYFYLMILGYLWLGTFSDLPYDHRTAEISAAISAFAFLLPAVLVRAPIPQLFVLSRSAFEKLPIAILMLAAAVIATGATYSFKIVPLGDIYNFREELGLPTPLSYLIGITSSALLPFAFACFVVRGAWSRAAAALILLFLFYPITLTKVAFFAPPWLVFVAVLSKILGSRITVVLSLGLPLLLGVVLMMFFPEHAYPYSHIVNLRMFAIPSNAMDIYNDFFAHHAHTYFCQISFLKRVLACPYREPLSVVMQQTYRLGYLNASLFATEGIASVGVLFAPIAVLVCGLVVVLANELSAGLPSRFILISSALLPLILSNVPLTTVLLTHGAAALFLLWYVMPRDFFASAMPLKTAHALPAAGSAA